MKNAQYLFSTPAKYSIILFIFYILRLFSFYSPAIPVYNCCWYILLCYTDRPHPSNSLTTTIDQSQLLPHFLSTSPHFFSSHSLSPLSPLSLSLSLSLNSFPIPPSLFLTFFHFSLLSLHPELTSPVGLSHCPPCLVVGSPDRFPAYSV